MHHGLTDIPTPDHKKMGGFVSFKGANFQEVQGMLPWKIIAMIQFTTQGTNLLLVAK